MQAPDLPANEDLRVAALRALFILDTQAEERFDRLTRMAAYVLDVPIARVSLIDSERQWFKSLNREQSETLAIARDSGRAMGRTIDDILDHAKLGDTARQLWKAPN